MQTKQHHVLCLMLCVYDLPRQVPVVQHVYKSRLFKLQPANLCRAGRGGAGVEQVKPDCVVSVNLKVKNMNEVSPVNNSTLQNKTTGQTQ